MIHKCNLSCLQDSDFSLLMSLQTFEFIPLCRVLGNCKIPTVQSTVPLLHSTSKSGSYVISLQAYQPEGSISCMCKQSGKASLHCHRAWKTMPSSRCLAKALKKSCQALGVPRRCNIPPMSANARLSSNFNSTL